MTQSPTAPSLLGLEEDGRDLFGLAAHKLNTPLACIRGFVSTLLQRGNQLDAETVQQFLQLVLTQVDRLQGLVRDFLLLARVSGGIEALTRPFRPRDVLRRPLGGARHRDASVERGAQRFVPALHPLRRADRAARLRRGPGAHASPRLCRSARRFRGGTRRRGRYGVLVGDPHADI